MDIRARQPIEFGKACFLVVIIRKIRVITYMENVALKYVIDGNYLKIFLLTWEKDLKD